MLGAPAGAQFFFCTCFFPDSFGFLDFACFPRFSQEKNRGFWFFSHEAQFMKKYSCTSRKMESTVVLHSEAHLCFPKSEKHKKCFRFLGVSLFPFFSFSVSFFLFLVTSDFGAHPILFARFRGPSHLDYISVKLQTGFRKLSVGYFFRL